MAIVNVEVGRLRGRGMKNVGRVCKIGNSKRREEECRNSSSEALIMRILIVTLAAGCLTLLAACGPTEPAADGPGLNRTDPSAAAQSGNDAGAVGQDQGAALPAANSGANSGESAAGNPADNAGPIENANAAGFPTVPDGALYTIYCMTIDTPTHVPDSNRLKEQLVAKTGSHDWYVIHSQNVSTLYYGFYKTFDDDAQAAEKARAQEDLHRVQALKDDNGDFPFASCIFQPLNAPDPAAPAEWDLKNANGYWTVQIAAYVGSPLRKQYAVDAVREARKAGIEAYFYHGRSISSVCIGTWPREAVKEQDSADARSDDASKHIMVLPRPLPEGTRTDNIYDPDGSKVKVVVPRVQIADPTLTAMMQQYPNNVVNGEVRYHTEHTATGDVQVADPSFLVIIPRGDTPDGGDDTGGAPTLPGANGDNGGGAGGGAADDAGGAGANGG
jgi:hypothetical protein